MRESGRESLDMVVIVVSVMVLSTGCSGQLRTTVGLDQAEIQKRVSKKFPVEKDMRVLALELSDPQIALENDSDRVGFSMKASARVGSERLDGRLEVDGALHFEPESKSFFLRDARVLELDFPGLDEAYEPTFTKVATAVVSTAFEAIPIYELGDQRMASAFVHDVRVEGGTVWVTMGL